MTYDEDDALDYDDDGEPDYQTRSADTYYKYGIVGEAQTSPDGTSRQEILKSCRKGDSVNLVRQPENEHDYRAIAVCLRDGKQIGYISKDHNWKMSRHLDFGGKVICRIFRVTGGPGIFGRLIKSLRKNYGCVIEVKFSPLTDDKSLDDLYYQNRKIDKQIEKNKSARKR